MQDNSDDRLALQNGNHHEPPPTPHNSTKAAMQEQPYLETMLSVIERGYSLLEILEALGKVYGSRSKEAGLSPGEKRACNARQLVCEKSWALAKLGEERLEKDRRGQVL